MVGGTPLVKLLDARMIQHAIQFLRESEAFQNEIFLYIQKNCDFTRSLHYFVSASQPPSLRWRNVETECFKNSILSSDSRDLVTPVALWCEKQECEDGYRPRRAAGPIHAHHQSPQNRRQGFQERMCLFLRFSRKCPMPPHNFGEFVLRAVYSSQYNVCPNTRESLLSFVWLVWSWGVPWPPFS